MKTVLITGANKGIGFETAKQLAQLGYFVYIGSRNKTRGIEAVNKLNSLDIYNIETIEIDVTDIHSIVKAKQVLETEIEALDILINNAGIGGEQPQNSSSYNIDKLREVFNTNYFGAIQTTQQFIPLMEKSEAPHIINISSEVGSLTMNAASTRNPNWSSYNAYGSSKTALNAFTVTLANEFRDTKFRVNSVTPGGTATELNQFKGTRTVEEGARSIVKLATLSNKGITGKFYKDGKEVLW
jgi:Dehydrogenases with different specificities (related to short-chain alcohol dehydrogenases)